MEVNPHLRNLDHVTALAQAQANLTKEDQAIYKTKDAKRYEIYQFIPAKNYGGNPVRVVQYARNDQRESILQDSGNEQPVAVGKGTKSNKNKPSRTTE